MNSFNTLIVALAYHHMDVKQQYNWRETHSLQSASYVDIVRLYASTGIIPGEKELNRGVDFNIKILKENKK